VLPEEYIELTFNVVAGRVNDVEPNNTSLNQLPDVSVAVDAPLANKSLGALAVEAPADVPNVNVLVALIVD
jgi:hypothetical protein